MSDYKEKLLTGTTYILTGTITVQILHIVISVINARLLGPENLGILSILRGIGVIVIPLIMCGIPIAITKFIAEYKIRDEQALDSIISTGFTILVITSIAGSIIYFLLSDVVAIGIYHEPILGLLIRINSIFILSTVLLNLGIAALQGFQKIRTIAILNVVNTLIGIPILYVFIIKMSLVGAVIAGAVSGIISLILILSIIKPLFRDEHIKLKLKIDNRFFKKMVPFALPITLSIFIVRPAYLFGITYLSLTQGFADVGLFKIASGIYNIILFVPGAISISLLPIISELHASSIEKRSTINSKILRLVLLFSLPLCLGVGLLSKYVILVLYGQEYIGAYFVTYIMAITAFFSAYFVVAYNIFLGTGRTWQALGFDVILACTFLLTSYYFIGLFGIIGLGLAYLVTNVILVPIELAYLIRKSELEIGFIWLPLLISTVFIFASFLVIRYLQGAMFFCGVAALITCSVCTLYVILSKEEKKQLWIVIKAQYSKLLSLGPHK